MPPFRRLLRWALLAFAALSVLGLLAAGTVYFVVASKLPDVEALRTVELQEPMYVHARDGKLIALFGETRRYPVDIKEVPEAIKQAFIAIEDNRFYEHHGVDYKGVARAIWLLATTDDERVRCVRLMPAYAVAASGEGTPGTTSKGMPCSARNSASSEPRPKR